MMKQVQQRHTPHSIHRLLASRRQRKHKQDASFPSRGGRVLWAFGLFGMALSLAAVLAAGGFYLAAVQNLPDAATLTETLDPLLFSTPTRFYDRSGQVLLYEMGYPEVERRWLSVDPAEELHFSPQLIQAVTALEENYWSGPGISLKGLFDPLPHTLAEQIVAEFLLPQDLPADQQGIALRILAVQAQLKFGKAKMLEWYLNLADFGRMTYGAEQAAQVYLGKSAAQVNLAESALLLAAMASPSLNPLDAPAEAARNARQILDRLAATGQYSESDIAQAREVQVEINPAYRSVQKPDEFIDYALHQVETWTGRRRLERGGLRVTTTLDADLQAQLLCTLQAQLDRVHPSEQAPVVQADCPAADLLPAAPAGQANSPISTSPLFSNGLLLDPLNGEILAWSGVIAAGGRQIQPRYQAGSLLTPFVAAAAFSRGMSPASLIWDVPQEDQTANLNPDGRWHGAQSLRTVIENGYLDAVYRTSERIGFENVWMLASAVGLTSLERDTFAQDLAQGAGETSLPEMGQAFSVFAALGTQNGLLNEAGTIVPAAVRQVEDAAGRVWFEQEGWAARPVLDEGLAYLVNDLLGTGTSTAGMSIGQPAAVAVRTAASGSQAWTVGYTPGRLLVVWMGAAGQTVREDEQTISAAFPASVWKAVMQYAARPQDNTGWQMPDHLVAVEVCQPSGQLPTAACPQTAEELFLAGSEPAAYDSLYKTLPVNRTNGLLATVFTPADQVEVLTFLDVPPEYEEWAADEGIPQPPLKYDPLPVLETNPYVYINTPDEVWNVGGQVKVTGSAAGEDFAAYQLEYGQGLYPRVWVAMNEETLLSVQDAELAVWDTTGLDGFYFLRLSVQRTGGQIDVAYVPVVVDNVPPTVRITWPDGPDAVFSAADQPLYLLAQAVDRVGISTVQWFIDGTLVGEQKTEPYLYEADLDAGEHVIRINGVDLAGNTAETEATLTIQ